MIAPRQRPFALALTLAAVASLGLSACSDSSPKAATTSTPAPTTSTATSSSAAPAAKPVAARNPFTGIGPVPKNPVIAVKIDDTAPGRPQVGIDKADIVYLEAVEGGLTRLAAIFGTTMPKEVGYVRSTRPSDPDLLLQFGKITEAYSGGAHDSLPRVHESGITSWSDQDGAAYYYRAPHPGDHGYINLALDLAQVAKHVHTPRPHSIGWTFSSSLAGLTTVKGTDVQTRVTGSYPHSGGTAVEFRWDAGLGRYVRYIDGQRQFAADGKPVATTNVIVQECRVVSHPEDTDVDGNPSQFTYTIGSGAVYVFRNGREIQGTWTRRHYLGGTYLHTASGKALPLDPGNTWVVLVRNGQPVTGS